MIFAAQDGLAVLGRLELPPVLVLLPGTAVGKIGRGNGWIVIRHSEHLPGHLVLERRQVHDLQETIRATAFDELRRKAFSHLSQHRRREPTPTPLLRLLILVHDITATRPSLDGSFRISPEEGARWHGLSLFDASLGLPPLSAF